MKFKNLPNSEKPREKALREGIASLSNAELLALFFRTGSKNSSVVILAQQFLEKIEGLKNLQKLSYQEITQMSGIGKVKAMILLASLELTKRIKTAQEEQKKILIKNPQDVYKIMENIYQENRLESFHVILLDVKNNFINKKMLYQGTKNQILIDLRDIFSFILNNNADKMICVHNHPSGNSTPSKEDIATTKEIRIICQKLNILFIDHIIIGKREFYSLSLTEKYLL